MDVPFRKYGGQRASQGSVVGRALQRRRQSDQGVGGPQEHAAQGRQRRRAPSRGPARRAAKQRNPRIEDRPRRAALPQEQLGAALPSFLGHVATATATVWWSMGRRRRPPARPSATRRPRCPARLRCASSTSPSVPTRPQRRERRAGKPTRAGCVSRGREGRRGGGQGGQPNAQLHREQPQDRDIVGMIDGIAFHTQHPRAERAGRGCRCRRTGGRLRGGRLGGSEPGAASRRCDLPGDAAIHRGSLPTPRSGPRQEPNPPGFEAKLIAAPGPVAIASATDD